MNFNNADQQHPRFNITPPDTMETIDAQRRKLEMTRFEAGAYEQKIADLRRKIHDLENELFMHSSHGRQIPDLTRENIGISIDVQFLEYESEMRQTASIALTNMRSQHQQQGRSPVVLDTSQYPYAQVVPQPGYNFRDRNAPLSLLPRQAHLSPNRSPSQPVIFQSSPNTMISTSGEVFNIQHRGSLNHVQTPSPPLPERPNFLLLPPRRTSPMIPTRPAPPPPTHAQAGQHQPGSTPASGASSLRSSPMIDEERPCWSCEQCSYNNHAALMYCEMCESARRAPPIGNIYSTFSSLYPRDGPKDPSPHGSGTSASPQSPTSPNQLQSSLLTPSPIQPTPLSPSSSKHHKSHHKSHHRHATTLVSFSKKRFSRKDKKSRDGS